MIAGKNQRDFEFVISLLCLERVVGVYRERGGGALYLVSSWSFRAGKSLSCGPHRFEQTSIYFVF